jgi:chloramphenicol-sensitive protein RarD
VGDGRASTRAGLIYGIAAYGLWGVMPLYFRAVNGVSPLELLAHRIVWCFLLLAGVLTVFRRWPDFARVVRTPDTLFLLALSAHLVAANWLIYIYGVSIERVVHTSLGYFINPLLSILLGMVFFRERLRPAQWLAVGLAAAGIGYLLVTVDEFPWIALGVAMSFALYGLVRKVTPVDGLTGLTVETLWLLPAAGGCLLWWGAHGMLLFGHGDRRLDALLLASGVVTAVPLICFGQAARRLPLSTLGFLQYLAPTAQFLIAVLWFGEPFGQEKQISFGLVWAALAVLTADSVLRARRPAATLPLPEPVAERHPVTCRDE